MKPEVRLEGKVAVVTGGGRGIGRATALKLAEAGASVVVAARTKTQIEETAALIRERGGQALAVPTDVSEWQAVERLAKETVRAFGTADIVVANAAVLHPVGRSWEVPADLWARNVEINLIGAFYTARAFLPALVERGEGVLVFVSSGAAAHPVPGWSAYCAAKAGLDHFARNLGEELTMAGSRVRVHVLYPGIVETAMQEEIRRLPPGRFPLVEQFRTYHEAGWLRPPEEPATLIWWLATPLAADWHGRIVSIDDEAVRLRMARDLGISPFRGRGA